MPLAQLSLIALGLGVVTGFGAVLFRGLIGLIHNLLFTGHAIIRYDANLFTAPSPWGALVILVPVLGAVGVTFLVNNFAPEAKGHGVPEVMDAIYYKSGVIRPIVALVKSLASAIAIGSGASVGREGPIIQIGSALGSTLGQIIRMPAGQRIALVAAGAGAGIAATFNTPIGGVMFAIELMMPEVSVETFLPVAIATGTATFVGRWFFGDAPAFHVPALQAMAVNSDALLVLALFALVGALSGFAAAGFIQGLHLAEDLFDRIKSRYLRHMLGMLMLGVLMYVLFRTLGQYFVDGVGYATVQAILTGQISTFWLLGVLCHMQAVGDIAQFGIGLVRGDLFALAFHGCRPRRSVRGTDEHPPSASTQRARLRDGRHGRDGGGRNRRGDDRCHDDLRDDSRLQHRDAHDRRGCHEHRGTAHDLSRDHLHLEAGAPGPRGPESAPCQHVFGSSRARGYGYRHPGSTGWEASFDDYLRQPEHAGRLRHVVVTDKDHVYGRNSCQHGAPPGFGRRPDGIELGDVASRNFTVVTEDETAFEVIRRMWRRNAIMAVVVRGAHGAPRGTDVIGVITKEHVADSVADSIKAYPL